MATKRKRISYIIVILKNVAILIFQWYLANLEWEHSFKNNNCSIV
jgi:hypothetical protein